jgi:cytochrome c oxidase assembly protein subunit 11
MVGFAYASVPLYQLFCQVTGFAGTPQRAVQAPSEVLERTVTVRFDANVSGGLPWSFEPLQRTVEVRIGETSVVHYRATNQADRDTTGTATFNVAPDQTGIYFNKLACFCFTEQTLAPGQSIDMPVQFFVDPAIVKDANAGKFPQITLSYTFYPAGAAKRGVAETSPDGKASGRGS